MTRLEILKETWARNLTRIRTERPEIYVWPIDELPAVISRMQAAFDRDQGINGCNIDSPTWRATAKDLGIKHTRKAFNEWLKG